MNRLTNATQIILLCVFVAVLYGVLQDQITVRLCLEYFTVGHVPIFGDQDPTILAIFWGTTASWWVGLPLGILLAIASTVGRGQIRSARSLVRPLAILLLIMGLSAALAGISGYYLTATDTVSFTGNYANRLAKDRIAPFLACAFAHDTSYLVGIIGSCFLIGKTWLRRKSQS